ncbi:hypothetical protein GCM10009414_22740 [Tatumella terrea]
MARTVPQNPVKPNNDGALSSLGRWEGCKPTYRSSHMRICVTAAKNILKHQRSRSKYEKESYLRIYFSKAGKVTFYAEFPKLRADNVPEFISLILA